VTGQRVKDGHWLDSQMICSIQLDSGEWFGFAAFYDPVFRSADRAVKDEAQGEGHRR
jgi:hypothetical protein